MLEDGAREHQRRHACPPTSLILRRSVSFAGPPPVEPGVARHDRGGQRLLEPRAAAADRGSHRPNRSSRGVSDLCGSGQRRRSNPAAEVLRSRRAAQGDVARPWFRAHWRARSGPRRVRASSRSLLRQRSAPGRLSSRRPRREQSETSSAVVPVLLAAGSWAQTSVCWHQTASFLSAAPARVLRDPATDV